MCVGETPKTPAPSAGAVPIPAETAKPAQVDSAVDQKLKRSGRSRLTIPGAAAATSSGMSGLNIPK
jgi:hypothetical protein